VVCFDLTSPSLPLVLFVCTGSEEERTLADVKDLALEDSSGDEDDDDSQGPPSTCHSLTTRRRRCVVESF
jgi:hypothetical protein